MADKKPIRAVFNDSNVATGLAEFQSGDTLGLTHGGLGASLSIGTAGQVLKVNSGASALEFGNVEAIVNIDGATDKTSATLVTTDLLLLSDGGTEGRVTLAQLDTLFSGTSKTLTNKTLTNPTITTPQMTTPTITSGGIIFEGSTADSFETTISVTDPTADRTITVPNVTGTIVTTGDTGSVTNTMLAGSIAAAKLAGSIGNAKLSNSSITVSDGSNTSAVSLGGTLTFAGTTNETTVAESSGTVTIGLVDNPTVGGNLTITGNLTVNGSTTTVSTTNTTVSDKLFELSTGTTGTPSGDIGIVGERGSSANIFIGFDESADEFTVGTGTFTGATTGDLTYTKGTLSSAGLRLYDPSDGSHYVSLVSPSISGNISFVLPNNDGDSNQVLITDGSGNLSFTSVSSAAGAGLSNVADDSSPSLGGDLDVETSAIVTTASNRNIALTPHGTGKVLIDGNVSIDTGVIDLKNGGTASKILFYCESSNAHAQTLQSAPHSVGATNTLTLPGGSTIGNSAATLVSDIGTQTLSNKTLTSPTIIFEGSTADSFETTLAVTDPTADRTITFPNATDTLVGKATTDTLTNKTLTSPTINSPTINSPTIVFEGSTADSFETTIAVTDPTADRTITLPNVSGTVITTGNLAEVTSAGIFSQNIVFEGSTANSFETTLAITDPTADRTVTIPNATDTLVGKATTDTLTNKSIDLETNTLTGSVSEFNSALQSDSFATLAGSNTLTNKTLTSPVINTPTVGTSLTLLEDAVMIFEGATNDSFETTLTTVDPTADRTVSLPNATDTLVGKATTDTLTNKSIDSDNNTITNIVNADIKSSAAIAFSKMENLTNARALVSDGSGDVSVSAVTSTEIGHLDGVSDNIQTQLDTKTTPAFAIAQAIALG